MTIKYGKWEVFNGGKSPLNKGEKARVQFNDQTRNEVLDEGADFLFEESSAWSDRIIMFQRVIEPVLSTHDFRFSVKDGESYYGHSNKKKKKYRNFVVDIKGNEITARWSK